jgi:hypothetical protein
LFVPLRLLAHQQAHRNLGASIERFAKVSAMACCHFRMLRLRFISIQIQCVVTDDSQIGAILPLCVDEED